ncbi:MAG: phytanoyl-CoA dioxygenase [Alphaproteobacteria bacterium]|nr:phytanoyl-CoA dioxygenase [Alphaproteobacteria bacterium]
MTKLPTRDEIAAYDRDGVVCLRQVIDAAWRERLAAGVETNMREPGPYAKRYTAEGKPGLFFGDYCNWARIPEYRDFMFNSPAAEIAGALMGARKVNLFHEHVLVKEPGTEEPTPWHNDQPYYFVDGRHVISMWIPLDPVPRQTCPEYVAGSHRWNKWYTPQRFADGKDHPARDKNFEPVPDIDGNRGQYTILGWELEPGDCIAFQGLTLHGAPPNRTALRRRGFSARWTGDDAVYVLRDGFMSPPPPKSGAPREGAPMDSEAFPVVWRAA